MIERLFVSRRGSADFKQYWHPRRLEHNGRTLTWILMDDPRDRRVHAECFRWLRGEGLHFEDARKILAEHDHPDLAHIPTNDTTSGRCH